MFEFMEDKLASVEGLVLLADWAVESVLIGRSCFRPMSTAMVLHFIDSVV